MNAYGIVFRFHLGTAAFGGLIIAFVQFLRCVLGCVSDAIVAHVKSLSSNSRLNSSNREIFSCLVLPCLVLSCLVLSCICFPSTILYYPKLSFLLLVLLPELWPCTSRSTARAFNKAAESSDVSSAALIAGKSHND